MTIAKRVRAVLGLNQDVIHLLLARAHTIHDSLDANKNVFPAPPVPCPTLLGQITDLETSQTAVTTGTHGAAEARNAKRVILVTSLESEFAYVKSIAKNAPPGQAESILKQGGMLIGATPKRGKETLAAVNILPAGNVVLRANASLLLAGMGSRRPTFHWEYTLDGSKTFVSAGSTPVANTVVTGLTPGTSVGFRVFVTVNKMPPGAPSQVVTILIH